MIEVYFVLLLAIELLTLVSSREVSVRHVQVINVFFKKLTCLEVVLQFGVIYQVCHQTVGVWFARGAYEPNPDPLDK